MAFKKQAMFLLTGVLILILLAGCNLGMGGGGGETLATHDIELPDGLESKIPLPKGSEIRSSISDDDIYGVIFTPGASYPDSIEFFSETFADSDWTVNKEDIPERTEGERTASWRLSGDGMGVDLQLTAFGDEEGFNMTGVYSIRERGEMPQGAEKIEGNQAHNRLKYIGSNMLAPEQLGDIPVIEGADIYRVITYTEETEPEGRGFTEVSFVIDHLEEDEFIAYYEEELAKIGFDEEPKDHFGTLNYLRGNGTEEIRVMVWLDDEDDTLRGKLWYLDENSPEMPNRKD